jgi:hypothetical protein
MNVIKISTKNGNTLSYKCFLRFQVHILIYIYINKNYKHVDMHNHIHYILIPSTYPTFDHSVLNIEKTNTNDELHIVEC